MRLPSQSLTMVLMLVTSVASAYLKYAHDTQGQSMWLIGAFLTCLFLTVALSALYAIHKNRHPLWGLLAITGLLGIVVLWFLPTAKPTDVDSASRFRA